MEPDRVNGKEVCITILSIGYLDQEMLHFMAK